MAFHKKKKRGDKKAISGTPANWVHAGTIQAARIRPHAHFRAGSDPVFREEYRGVMENLRDVISINDSDTLRRDGVFGQLYGRGSQSLRGLPAGSYTARVTANESDEITFEIEDINSWMNT